ncbi:MAG: S8 family peptidase, partial [Candidatus Eisenbacteria bacterium]
NQLVAQLAPPADGALRASAADRAAPRLAALGLVVERAFRANGTDRGHFAMGAPLDPGIGHALPARYGFAPERIVLLEAPDSALAASAMRVLVNEALVDWVEPLCWRTLQMISLEPVNERLEPQRAATLDSLPNDPLLRATKQWGLYNLGGQGYYGGQLRADVKAPEAWRVSTGSETVKLAIADTGIDPAQPELGGLLADGSPRIVDAMNVSGDDPSVVTDRYGHGTPVAGVAVSRTNDGPHFSNSGVAGVCGGDGVGNAGCAVVPIKITSGGTGYASSWDIALAVIYAADVGARAVNLSFAGEQPSRLERMALTYSLLRGCIVVAAAGNSGSLDPTKAWYPAAYALSGLCIQVGASNVFDERVTFSSYGPGLDLVAPGVNIQTTFMTYPSDAGAVYDGYVAASGTSFAAPFVTGAVGLLAAVRPELTDTDFQHILRESADDIGAPGVDSQTGHGRLNLARALEAVHPRLGLWHDEVAADSFHVEGAGMLTVGERGPGTMDRYAGEVYSSRIAAYATVVLPDSFPNADSVRVWPRIGGTFAARGDFRLDYFAPSAEVVSRNGRTFTLRGWLYRIDEDSCASCDDSYVPLAPSNVRFGFTALGPVTRPLAAPPTAVPDPVRALRFKAGPNPFREVLELSLPSDGTVTVHDAAGRVVRRFACARRARWDGRDGTGRESPAGLYLVRFDDGQGAHCTRRVVRL